MTAPIPDELFHFLESSRIALALAAPDGDHPLAMVNERFRNLTGYADAEVVGRNCRFLQRDAENAQARAQIHEFLKNDRQANVRTDLVNFRKDGTPFVNLLYMSKLRNRDGRLEYIFASQFDISRSRTGMLANYDEQLSDTLLKMRPILAETGTIVEGSLITMANSATMIAQAKMLLSSLAEAPSLD